MFQKMTQAPIRVRLPLLIVGALLSSLLTLSLYSYLDFRKEFRAQSERWSEAIAERSIESVQRWSEELIEEITALAFDRSSVEMLERLQKTLSMHSAPTLTDLRNGYIDDNPYPLGERHQLNRSAEGTIYDFVHADLHDQFRGITKRSGYYDLFFILSNGDVAYSVFKEDDFGTNLLDGPYANSGLADSFRKALAESATQHSFSDFAPYAPSGDAPASFMAHAIVDDTGEPLGVVAVQLPTAALKAKLTASTALTPQDEIYVLGPQGLARTDSLEPDLLTMLDQAPSLSHLETSHVGQAQHFEGVEGLRGNSVYAYVSRFDFLGTDWTAVVERDQANVAEPLYAYLYSSLVVVGIGVVLSLVIGYLLARSVIGPLDALSKSMQRVAEDDFESTIDCLDRHDEFGEVAEVLSSFKEKLRSAKVVAQREARTGEEQACVVENLASALKQLADGNLKCTLESPFPHEYEELRTNFNATLQTMNELMRSIVENSNEIHARSEEISASSDDLSQRTENQAATLEQTAAALDELTSSVREAAQSASDVETVVTEARRDAEESGVVVAEAVSAMSLIRKSSTEISQIIGVIDDIAFQTNLLSLNAGVEAARAGEAGRGFAVVASEVRALAQRSSEAAKQIKALITSSSEQVETGVGLVGRTGDALGTIIEKVGNIDQLVSGIASGSREQSVGLGEINIGMTQLDQVTQQNAAMVEEATAAATTLRGEAASLTHLVAKFELKGADHLVPKRNQVVAFKSTSMQLSPDLEEAYVGTDEIPKRAAGAGGWTDF